MTDNTPAPPKPKRPSLLARLWAVLIQDHKGKQIEQAISIIAFVSLGALVIAFALGAFLRADSAKSNTAGGLVAVVVGLSAWGVGGLFGLIFGNPRFGSTTPTGDAKTSVQGLQPNNGLEKVSEWLTTMIVGLGLVHLKTIWDKANELGQQITGAIAGAATTDSIPGLMLSLAFGFLGFMFVFLWTLRFLPAVLNSTYVTQEQIDKVRADFERFKEVTPVPVDKEEIARVTTELQGIGADAATIQTVKEAYEGATRWDSEPLKDFGPASADGYSLSAAVTQVNTNMYDIVVTLSSANGDLVEPCRLLLHNTYRRVTTELTIDPSQKNRATCRLQASGAFWLGAVIVANGKTIRLGFDLATVPGVPAAFLDN